MSLLILLAQVEECHFPVSSTAPIHLRSRLQPFLLPSLHSSSTPQNLQHPLLPRRPAASLSFKACVLARACARLLPCSRAPVHPCVSAPRASGQGLAKAIAEALRDLNRDLPYTIHDIIDGCLLCLKQGPFSVLQLSSLLDTGSLFCST